MTEQERVALIGLLREERGFVGFCAERLGLPLDEVRTLIDGDPEAKAVMDYEQATVTSEEAEERSAAACRRQLSTNPDIQRLAELRLRERREPEETSSFLARVLSPPGKPA